MKRDPVLLYKLLALGAVGLYLYKASLANGGTLKGNPYGINFNGDRLVDTVMPWLPIDNQTVKTVVRDGAKQLLKNYFQETPIRRYDL